ncbi:unnamed protein product [Linum tenue]|uniref:Basic blue protein n=1 Tax=Linum tenue TaxID=586396 RepID=A0AAV0GTI2_9ROSI|nr:unnamed protein product [Linum tenue]
MKGAIAILATTMVLFMFAVEQMNPADAASYTVTWTFGAGSWPAGKSFKAGDMIVFKYPKGVHNVAVVGSGGYSACSAAGAKVYSSGNDQLTLAKGANYFICAIPGHCQANLKMTVNAS